MNLRGFWNEDYLLWEALALSVAVHFLLMHAGTLTFNFHQKHMVEIDITNMGHMGSTLQAPPKLAAHLPAPPKPAVKPKEWVQPHPTQRVAARPTANMGLGPGRGVKASSHGCLSF